MTHPFLTRWAVVVALIAATRFLGAAPVELIPSSRFSRIAQSSDASPTNGAPQAVDGATGTFSLTGDLPGSYWMAELGRPFPLSRVELVNRLAPADTEIEGLTLRLYNIDDQIVFQTGVTNPGSGGTWGTDLPAGLEARTLWIGLLGSQTNGAGDHRVGLAEARLFGSLAMPFGPDPVPAHTNTARVYQSTDYSSSYPAANAVDGDPATFSHTLNFPDSYWMADLGSPQEIYRVEIVNRSDCCAARLAGLVLRIFDGASNSVISAVLTNPGAGGTWTYVPPAGTTGRYVRVGIEGGQETADGTYYVTLAEARVFSGATNLLSPGTTTASVTNNLASFKSSYMVRLTPSVPAATNANDDNYSTQTETTMATVDAYWEVDLGATYALYGVRAIAASGIGSRMTNTTLRLYDEAHNSVFAQPVTGTPDVFDSDLNGPALARYARIGLENKQRTDPNGGLEWYIGMREVEVFGRPTNEIGILAFTGSTSQVSAGQPFTLSWRAEDVRRLEIHPGLGSVGASTAASGIGSVSLTPSNSTEYVLLASNALGFSSSAVSVQVGSSPPPVQISEFVANNQYSLSDGYGDSSDWIELRNCGNTMVDLTGWGLSDDPAKPMKWVFPPTNMAPHSLLIVFASGSDTPFDPAGYLHASFKLKSSGGALVLTARDGVTIMDALAAYPALDTDLAYGRNLEGSWCFLEPTPGAVNVAQAYNGWLQPLSFSQARGFFETAFTLNVSNSNPGAQVFYSLDGSTPSVPYTGGIPISATKAVRASVTRPGYKSPRIQTQTYVFINSVIASPVMQTAITKAPQYAARMRPGLLALPSISLVIPGQPEYGESEGSLEILWPDGQAPESANCGLSRFGGSYEDFAKKSFRAKFRAIYGASNLEAPLFNGFDHGVTAQTSFDELEFRSGSQDMVERGFYMAGPFVEDTMMDMGNLNPHNRFVHVYVNGVYWGQYHARETLSNHLLAKYLGGSPDDYVKVLGNDNVGDDFVVGTPEPPNVLPWVRVLSLEHSYAGVRPYLDVTSLADFMLMWFYGNCESEFRACGPLVAGAGFKFWEADADGFLNSGALGLDRTANTGPGDIFGDLVAQGDKDFKTLLSDRIYRACFNNGALTPAGNDARLGARMQEIQDSLLAECARWGYRTPANWESAAAMIRSNLFPVRTSQLLTLLRGRGLYPAFDPPTLNQYGGLVTNGFLPQLSATQGTIYYTLDGSDPRLPGGGVSPQALVWTSGAVSITQQLTLYARVRTSGGLWSALAQPRFFLPTLQAPTERDLVVTEINYHPVSGTSEFVELWNAGTNLLDLSGVQLSQAVSFTFPNGFTLAPGALVVVIKDAAVFAQIYQDAASPWYWPGINIAGEWSGSLNNDGETLSLVASNGVELASISYQPGGNWPARANGLGSSLELRTLPSGMISDQQTRAFVADGRNWNASSLYNGSPGRFDSFAPSVRINEILAHPATGDDWIELLNTGGQIADLTGCTLTDKLGQSGLWPFPAGTTLLPGQFSVIPASQMGFGLSQYGESVTLLLMAGTQVIRFLDEDDFPATQRGETMGLFPRSDGVGDFTELRSSTPGAANSLPRVGPVVFSEIMYAPAPGLAEFIELANITNVEVPLFDPVRPTNVWTIEGGGNFTFPPGTIMAPGSSLVICATSPASFRAQYGIGASVPVVGPWSGSLDETGESLTLLQPGAPEPDGTIPYYRVDHVTYGTSTPWPPAGNGVSLEKFPLVAYGNDPAYWRVTPANGTPGILPINPPPVWSPQPDVQLPAGMPWSIPLSVADVIVPWQSLVFQADGLPAGFLLNTNPPGLAGTGLAPGNYPVTITASDDQNPPLATTLQFSIQLTEPFSLTAQLQPVGLRLTFPTIAGGTYRVEYAENLTTPAWQLLEEFTAVSTKAVNILDLQAVGASRRFYRARWIQ